ncbi:hypothetical protein EVAR_23301_1 [Eumeta japonica]|uniref:Uncharacterized protein n=1 Tax=Eumeta variegata TaxID=151549 RepID=A0A4C1V7H6_EUMVA|nr:hypothetical protein EVAR_23301_1 [Eumeta japonica]
MSVSISSITTPEAKGLTCSTRHRANALVKLKSKLIGQIARQNKEDHSNSLAQIVCGQLKTQVVNLEAGSGGEGRCRGAERPADASIHVSSGLGGDASTRSPGRYRIQLVARRSRLWIRTWRAKSA